MLYSHRARNRATVRSAHLDITVTSLRFMRWHTEEHHGTVFSGLAGAFHRNIESRFIGNQMVRRQYQQQLVTTLPHQVHRRQSDGRRRVATKRLEHDLLRAHLALVQLIINNELVFLVANDNRCLNTRQPQTR